MRLQRPPKGVDKHACALPRTNAVGPADDPGAPKLLDWLPARIRARHYSILTEDAYVDWTKVTQAWVGIRWLNESLLTVR